MAINPGVAKRCFDDIGVRYGNDGEFRRNFIYSIVYVLSAGVTHSVQYAMAAMFDAACEGRLDFVGHTREYARRAARVKEIMQRNGFHVVYDNDCGREVSDGFFFTFGYKDMTSEQLINKLIYYGVSAIALGSTGSAREGLRGCVSNLTEDQYDELDRRLQLFSRDY